MPHWPQSCCAIAAIIRRRSGRTCCRLAAEEAEHGGAGSEGLLARLAELMFIEVVRKYINDLPEDSKGRLSGLKHRHVGHALRLIHGQPAKPWTLATPAREVGLSRSVFADRFAHYVGVSPMHYLGRWHMQPHVSRPGATSRAICTSAAISGVSGSRCGMTRPTL